MYGNCFLSLDSRKHIFFLTTSSHIHFYYLSAWILYLPSRESCLREAVFIYFSQKALQNHIWTSEVRLDMDFVETVSYI